MLERTRLDWLKPKFLAVLTDPWLVLSMTETIQELFQRKAIKIVKLEPKDYLIKAIWVHQHKLDTDGHLRRIKSCLFPPGFRYQPWQYCVLCITCTDNWYWFVIRGATQYIHNSPRHWISSWVTNFVSNARRLKRATSFSDSLGYVLQEHANNFQLNFCQSSIDSAY